MAKNSLSISTKTIITLLGTVSPSWAVQAHGGAEGLVSHQIGHILFTCGMAYLLFRLYKMHLKGPGWLEFRTFLWLLVVWNLITFSGHWLNESIAAEKLLKVNSIILSFLIETPLDAIYYLTRLDHLVLVPAFLFLLLALKKWGRTQ